MSFIDWKDSYSVKIAKIDSQHQKLLCILNQLHDGIVDKKSEKIMKKLLDELMDYTQYHFKTEEDYFRQFDYPDIDAHCQSHKLFVERIMELIEDRKNGKTLIAIDLMEFLTGWLIDHIGIEDLKYSDFLNEHGVM